MAPNTKFTVYKYVKLEHGWRYCKAVYHPNFKIKPDVVHVAGVDEIHRDGSYYLNANGKWIPAGKDALEADKLRRVKLSEMELFRLLGTPAPVAPTTKPSVSEFEIAEKAYLDEIDRGVRSLNKAKSTWTLMRNTLRKFQALTKVKYLSDITVRHLDEFAAHVIETSPTHSRQTGRNEYLRVLQFLKSRGIVLTKQEGDKRVPLGMKDAPKVVKGKKTIINTQEELDKFFDACVGHKQWVTFQTFYRAGLREMELVTLRWQDVVLDSKDDPHISVGERTVKGFRFAPKWYACRDVSIDPFLVAELKKLKSYSKGELVFGTASDEFDRHLLRTCKRIAKRAELEPARFRLHRFRACYATKCLRSGMDLETLREQMGHKDTESLRCYVTALRGEQRATTVARVWAESA
jgi:integrase